MGKIITIGFVIAILLGLTYYFYQSQGLDKRNQDIRTKEVTIAWVGPLTGPASVFGIDSLKSVELAVLEYESTKAKDDPKINLAVEDDRYSHEKTLYQYRKLMEYEKPVAVFVNTYSGVKKLAPYLVKDNVIVIDSLDSDLNLSGNKNMFFVAKETEEMAHIYAASLINLGKKNVAILFKGVPDDFMKVLSLTLNQILDSEGVKTELYSYDTESLDIPALLQKVKKQDADALVILGYNEIGEFIQQSKKMGIDVQLFTSAVVLDKNFSAKNEAEGALFVHFSTHDGNIDEAEEFLRNYKSKHHNPPSIEWVAMQAYDATNILLQAIRKAYHQKGNFNDALNSALLQTSKYDGVTGQLSMQPNGMIRGIHPSLYRLKDGQAEMVK